MPSPSAGFARYLCASVATALLLLTWAARVNAQNTIQVPANQPTMCPHGVQRGAIQQQAVINIDAPQVEPGGDPAI